MRSILTMITLVAPLSSLPCQTQIWFRTGYAVPTGLAALSGPLAPIGDVNGDGFDDLLQFVNGGLPPQGLWIFSGRDGATLRMQPPFQPNHAVRTVATTGDMNGDGIGDYAVGYRALSAPFLNIVEVRSASDDALLWQASAGSNTHFAHSMVGDLDTDGDGLRDLVVGAERENVNRGAIRVYANNGTLRYVITIQPGLYYLGRSLAKVGDVNGDGCDDFVTGAVNAVGLLVVYSGANGAELRRGYGDIDGVLGWSVTGCGDMNGDGVPDFAGGTSGGTGDRGMVRVFSGATAASLYTLYSPATLQYGNGFGRELFGGFDANRDGVPDVIVCNADYTGASQPGSVVAAYSGRDGSRLFRLDMGSPGFLVAFMRPQPGSPFPRFVTNSFYPYFPLPGLPDLYKNAVHSTAPPGVEAFGQACAGASPRAPKIGIHGIGQLATRIHVSDGEPGGFGVLALGLSNTNYLGWPLPWPLSGFGFTGCMLSSSIDVALVLNLGTSGLAAGYAAYDLFVPLAATGLDVHGQWLTLRAATAAPGGVSDALRWRL